MRAPSPILAVVAASATFTSTCAAQLPPKPPSTTELFGAVRLYEIDSVDEIGILRVRPNAGTGWSRLEWRLFDDGGRKTVVSTDLPFHRVAGFAEVADRRWLVAGIDVARSCGVVCRLTLRPGPRRAATIDEVATYPFWIGSIQWHHAERMLYATSIGDDSIRVAAWNGWPAADVAANLPPSFHLVADPGSFPELPALEGRVLYARDEGGVEIARRWPDCSFDVLFADAGYALYQDRSGWHLTIERGPLQRAWRRASAATTSTSRRGSVATK